MFQRNIQIVINNLKIGKELIETAKSELSLRMSKEYYSNSKTRSLYLQGEDIPVLINILVDIKAVKELIN